MNYNELKKCITDVSRASFEEVAIEVYKYQYANNDLYKQFVDGLRRGSEAQNVKDIPTLPISFFKSHEVISGKWIPEAVYKSSATTGTIRSKHRVRDNSFYKREALATFEKQYGSIEEYCIIGLLPGYLDRGDSSLVSMTAYFIQESKDKRSGFYLDEVDRMKDQIDLAKAEGKKVILLGVSYALWQLLEKGWDLRDVIIMETGGMKGKGPELPKAAFHELLCNGLKVDRIHSEYGMTELLSQAYSQGEQRFWPSDKMHVMITDVTDPLTKMEYGRSGVINIIDLANIDSCSFIATEDLGICHEDGSFEVLGRVDAAEIRGCNLLVSDL